MPVQIVGTRKLELRAVSALLLWECEQRYTRQSIALTAGTYEIGEVIANATAGASHEGFGPTISDVLCLENITVPDGETLEVAALVRGPALVNFDEVIKTSAGESDSSVSSRLADLKNQGVVFVREPAVQSTPNLFQ